MQIVQQHTVCRKEENGKKLARTFFNVLATDNGINMVKFFKRMICVVITLLVTVIKNLIRQSFNCVVNSLKGLIVVLIIIIFCAFFNQIMVCRYNLCGFISGIGIPFFFKVPHNLCGRLIKTFISQNAFLLFIVTINNHDKTSVIYSVGIM